LNPKTGIKKLIDQGWSMIFIERPGFGESGPNVEKDVWDHDYMRR
jgi:hypothetical protein